MCGIAGIINIKSDSSPTREELNKMIYLLNHRGPDDYGYYCDEQVGLAHARLSIIDVEGGHQPIYNTDKSAWVIFNGEIYNYIELREQLIKKGYVFYTKSDTEVIIKLYDEYGEEFVSHLNGQFAIAIWDVKKKKLILARDRVGIAPLFYSKQNNKLIFSSEIKSIISVSSHKPELNRMALDQLFTFWSPSAPNTMFENVFQVLPGEMLVVEKGGVTSKKYWGWEYPVDGAYLNDSVDVLSERLHDLLVDATRIRLRADVPVGAYLSGGLDSSILVSVIKNFTDTSLSTFSLEFDEKGLDESKYQKELIEHLDVNHNKIKISHEQIADNFESVIWHTELPILRSAPIPMSLLSGLVHSEGYKVVLTGEGADEVFGGYDIFKETKIRQFWAKNKDSGFRPALLKKLYPYLDVSPGKAQAYLKLFFGQGIDNPDLNYFSHIPRWETTSKIKGFYSDDMKAQLRGDVVSEYSNSLPAEINRWHPFNKAQYIESKTLMSGYLLCSQGDRVLMKNSVEGRYPFLDHRLIEFANMLHPKYKMKGLNEKYLLKKAMGKYIPKSIVNRYKQPYRSPDIPSFTGDSQREYVTDLLSSSKISQYNYFDPKKVELLKKKIINGKAIGYKDNMAFMGILSAQCLHKLFLENEF